MNHTPELLKSYFDQALPYADYVATDSAAQPRWQQVYDAIALTDQQTQLLGAFTREMNILVSSGTWCGDCVLQGPIIARLAEACPQIDLRLIDRETIPELRDAITVCGGTRVPVALFMAEDFHLCSVFGDRTLNRYRALAAEQIGPACSTGLFVPDKNELAAVTQDWLDEIERIQLMLRLSTRLRQKHGD